MEKEEDPESPEVLRMSTEVRAEEATAEAIEDLTRIWEPLLLNSTKVDTQKQLIRTNKNELYKFKRI
jgi:hypothetical protein